MQKKMQKKEKKRKKEKKCNASRKTLKPLENVYYCAFGSLIMRRNASLTLIASAILKVHYWNLQNNI